MNSTSVVLVGGDEDVSLADGLEIVSDLSVVADWLAKVVVT